MRALRFLLAAIIVIAALCAGFFALAIVAVVGLVALAVHSIRRKAAPPAAVSAGASSLPVYRQRPAVAGEVIDVEATDVAEAGRS